MNKVGAFHAPFDERTSVSFLDGESLDRVDGSGKSPTQGAKTSANERGSRTPRDRTEASEGAGRRSGSERPRSWPARRWEARALRRRPPPATATATRPSSSTATPPPATPPPACEAGAERRGVRRRPGDALALQRP